MVALSRGYPGAEWPLGDRAVAESAESGSSASLQAGAKLPVCSACRVREKQEAEKGGLAQSGKGNQIGGKRLSSPAIASVLCKRNSQFCAILEEESPHVPKRSENQVKLLESTNYANFVQRNLTVIT